jgi:hypothetical protein
MFVSTHGITARPTSSAYGTLTTAWIAATGETDLTILGALNTLESDLTTYGLTAKMKALYPFVGGTAIKHSYNFMNTAANQITWSGGLTHSSTGVLPNGVNGLGTINYNWATVSSGLTFTNNHLSFYSRTNTTSPNANDITGSTNSGSNVTLQARNPFSLTSFYSTVSASVANSLGYYLGTTLPTTSKIFKNGTSIGTAAQTGGNFTGTTGQVTLFSQFGTSYSARESAFASFGEGLSDTEAANFSTAVQAFQTTLARQV